MRLKHGPTAATRRTRNLLNAVDGRRCAVETMPAQRPSGLGNHQMPVGAGNCVTACDLGVFAGEAAGPVPPENAHACCPLAAVAPRPRPRARVSRARGRPQVDAGVHGTYAAGTRLPMLRSPWLIIALLSRGERGSRPPPGCGGHLGDRRGPVPPSAGDDELVDVVLDIAHPGQRGHRRLRRRPLVAVAHGAGQGDVAATRRRPSNVNNLLLKAS
jgi:hypothetical protein